MNKKDDNVQLDAKALTNVFGYIRQVEGDGRALALLRCIYISMLALQNKSSREKHSKAMLMEITDLGDKVFKTKEEFIYFLDERGKL